MKTCLSLLLWTVCLLAVVLVGAGCRTSDVDNESSRPWAQPRGWESGIPGLYNEGR